jgi:hypothetical protein
MNGTRDVIPHRTNERTQGKRLARIAKRLSFAECGACETKGSLYKAYEPDTLGWRLWCYVCGARDAQCESFSVQGDREYIPMKLLRETIAMMECELKHRKG